MLRAARQGARERSVLRHPEDVEVQVARLGLRLLRRRGGQRHLGSALMGQTLRRNPQVDEGVPGMPWGPPVGTAYFARPGVAPNVLDGIPTFPINHETSRRHLVVNSRRVNAAGSHTGDLVDI